MKNIQEYHSQALEIVDLAFLSRFKGEEVLAIAKFKEALDYEKQAALLAKSLKVGEPTESILCRSAASIALNARELREAEKLVSLGLSGEPPHAIAEELRNLLEEINFDRHLNLQGVTLDESEVQMVVAGKSIGYGVAKSDEIIDRLDIFEKITFRTAERKLGRDFRKTGGFPKDIKDSYQSYWSAPRAASFALTIKLGHSKNQLRIPGTENAIEIIDDIVENISLINEGDLDKLREKIPNKTYLTNFINLAKELAPDGDDVNLIGFTFIRGGIERKVKFTRKKGDFSGPLFDYISDESNLDSNDRKIELKGVLSAADSDKSHMTIKSIEGTKYSVEVPDGLGDIVKNYFEETILIKGTLFKPKSIRLIAIDHIR